MGRWGLLLGSTALGIALLVLLVRLVGAEDVGAALAAADPVRLALAFLLISTMTVTMGLRWWVAHRLLGHRGRLLSLIRANCASNVVNFVAPGHFGEPMLAAWLGRSGRAPGVEAFTVLVACKALGTLLNGVVLLVCVPLLLWETRPDDARSIVLVTAVSIAVALAGLAVLTHPRWARIHPFVARFRDTLALFATSPRAVLAVAGLGLVKLVTVVWAVALVYAALGAPLTPVSATFLMSADALGNLVSIWIPGNLGVQEAIHSGAAVQGVGVDGPTAVAASLAFKILQALHIAVGGLLFVALGRWDQTSP